MNELYGWNFKLVCPQCGGTYFGSELNDDGTLTRHCHGSASWGGCGFSWHESDDEKYAWVCWEHVKTYLPST